MSLFGWLFWCWLCGGDKEEKKVTGRQTTNVGNQLIYLKLAVVVGTILFLFTIYIWWWGVSFDSIVNTHRDVSEIMSKLGR